MQQCKAFFISTLPILEIKSFTILNGFKKKGDINREKQSVLNRDDDINDKLIQLRNANTRLKP